MAKLTHLQRQLLVSISKCPEGAFSPAIAKKATTSLIKRGLIVEGYQPEGPSRLLITDAGKALCAGDMAVAEITSPAGRPRSRAATPAQHSSPIRGTRSVSSTLPELVKPAASASNENTTDLTVHETVAPPAGSPTPLSEPKGKIAVLLGLLRRSAGATLAEMMAATGWQAHSVRGTLSGAIKNRLGLPLLSRPSEMGRVYSVPTESDA